MPEKEKSRFCFLLKTDNSELDDYISFMFTCFAQSEVQGNLTKRIRSYLNDIYGSGWCVIQGVELDKAIRYYRGYCCLIKDRRTNEEILIFRPSSMPITEVMKEDDTFDSQDWKENIKIKENTMNQTLFDYVKKSIAFCLNKDKKLSSFELRKQITIGCGPLFHTIVSTSPIQYSLDEEGDQLLYCTVDKYFILSWRHLLKSTVFNEKKRLGVIVSIFLYFQYTKCTTLFEKTQVYDFFEDDYAECVDVQHNMIYALVVIFAVWAYLHSQKKKRHINRVKEQRKYLKDAIMNEKKQN